MSRNITHGFNPGKKAVKFESSIRAITVSLWCEENVAEATDKNFTDMPFYGPGWKIYYNGTWMGTSQYSIEFDDDTHLTMFLLNPPITLK